MFIDYSDSNGKRYSYNDLLLFAQKIDELIGKRNIVLLLAENNIASIFAYASCLITKNVIIMLDGENTSLQTLDGIQSIYQANYVWCKKSKKYFFEKEDVLIEEYGYILIKLEDDKKEINNELALLMPTSGSVGMKKMVKLSYRNLYANTRDICHYLSITKEDVAITNLPIFYVYGLSIINTHIIKKATLVITNDNVLNNNFWNIVTKEGVTSLSGVPFTYEMFLRCGLEKKNLDSIRYFTQAGGKMSIKLEKKILEICQTRSIDFYVMYGQSEATARISYILITENKDKLGSVGKAIPHGKIKIYSEEGKEIKENNKEGEIVYEGENVFGGYAKELSDLIEFDQGRVLYTGDIGYLDGDNDLYITGRKNRFIKCYGKRISLDEIEYKIDNFSSQKACVCIQRNDKLYVFLKRNVKTDEEVRRILWKEYKMWKNTISIIHIDDFEYNQYGKVQYFKMEEIARMKERIIKCINQISEKKVELSELSENNFLYELDFDSISIINLVVLLEEEFEINFSDQDILSDSLKTFSGLCDLIKRLVGEQIGE